MAKSFTDSEIKIVSFERADDINKVTKDCATSTGNIVSTDQNTQTMFKRNIETQTEENHQKVQPQYDEEALLEFMRRMSPKVEDELRKRQKFFDSDFKQSSTDEDEVTTKKIFDLQKHEKITDMKCRHISWNCWNNKIAVSFSRMKHDSWCKHTSYILIYECDKNEEFLSEAKGLIEVNTCIVDLKFHPILNSVLIFGTDEGKIFWYNNTESLEINSKNFIYHKNEKITQISWVNVDSSLYLAVGGSDGLLYLWTTSSFIDEWKVSRIFTFKLPEDITDRGVQRFEFSKLNSEKFIVALEGGKLVYCSTISVSKTDDLPCYSVVNEFDGLLVIINGICFSPFNENIFGVSSLNQQLRIYMLSEKCPIYVIAAEYFPLGLEWSHLQEDVFMTWAADGKIRFHNYRKCTTVKTLNLGDSIFSASFKVKGMKQLFAVANSENVSIWQTTLYVR